MDEHIVFADKIPPSLDPTGTLFKNVVEAKGSNARSLVLLIVLGRLIILVGNYVLYAYARKNLPPRRRNRCR